MSGTAPSATGSGVKPKSALTVEPYYTELCSNIRTTDDTSFKLLGLVPLISGAGIITVLSAREKLQLPPAAVVLVAIFAAVVTLALYRWERRNIDICNWLIECAADVEREMLEVTYGLDPGKLHELPARSSPDIRKRNRTKMSTASASGRGRRRRSFSDPATLGGSYAGAASARPRRRRCCTAARWPHGSSWSRSRF